VAALLAIGEIYTTLSEQPAVGPRGPLLALEAVLLVPLLGAHLRGRRRLARTLAIVVTALITGAVMTSAVLLAAELPSRTIPALALLGDATLIWATNVLVFTVWYWEIDSGGPLVRRTTAYRSDDVVFPQMSADAAPVPGWSPGFVDYLFLAFNTSTAFSPTDTAVLSQRAKLLMMAQSLNSLVVIAVLAALSVNTL